MLCLFLSPWQGCEVDTTLTVLHFRAPRISVWMKPTLQNLYFRMASSPPLMSFLMLMTSSETVHHLSVFFPKSSPRTQQLWCRHLVGSCGHSHHPNWWCPPNAKFRCVCKLKDHLNLPESHGQKKKAREGYDRCAFNILYSHHTQHTHPISQRSSGIS